EARRRARAAHSGSNGGPVRDARSVLARTLATLHDDRGNVAIEGLHAGGEPPVDTTEDELRREASVRPGVELTGEGPLTERMWRRPAVAVLGIDAPSVRDSSNQIVPRARARVSLRIAPGQEPAAAMDALVRHLESHVPWGAEVHVERGASGEAFLVKPDGPAYDAARRALGEAWGVDAVEIGVGG